MVGVKTRRKFFATKYEPVTFEVELTGDAHKDCTGHYEILLSLASAILKIGAVPVCEALNLLGVATSSKSRGAEQNSSINFDGIEWEHREIIVPEEIELSEVRLTFSHNFMVTIPTNGSVLYEMSDSFQFVGDDIGAQAAGAWDCVISAVYENAKPALVKGGRIKGGN